MDYSILSRQKAKFSKVVVQSEARWRPALIFTFQCPAARHLAFLCASVVNPYPRLRSARFRVGVGVGGCTDWGMNVIVAGAGAWGTAMAVVASRAGQTVTLVPRGLETAMALAEGRENTAYLPGVALPESLQIGFAWPAVLLEAEVVMLGCPSAGLRGLVETIRTAGEQSGREAPPVFLTLCKGLEAGTDLLPGDVVREALGAWGAGAMIGALSGPSHADEVAKGLPTALVLGWEPGATEGDGTDLARRVQAAFSGATLRVYTVNDRRGVELGGCLKNVYAIAAGVCDGLHVGDNAKAALLTRALAEMTRLGVVLGGRPETFAGLSGFGDLIATSFGPWSRNRTFGQQLAQGGEAAALAAASTVEGYRTTAGFARLASAHALRAPILEQIADLLAGRQTPPQAMRALMSRDLREE